MSIALNRVFHICFENKEPNDAYSYEIDRVELLPLPLLVFNSIFCLASSDHMSEVTEQITRIRVESF